MSATARVDALARLRAAVDTADKATIIAYLDSCWDEDKGTLHGVQEAISLLQKLGRRDKVGRFVAGLIADIRPNGKAKKEAEVVGMDGLPVADQLVFDVPGMPEGTALPPGYLITPEGLIRKGAGLNEYILISHLLIVPIGIYKDMSSSKYHVELTWQTEDHEVWTTRTVPRGTVADARAIVSLAHDGAPVDSTSASEIVRWISAVLQHCELPTTFASSVLGWQDGGRRGFMWGATCIGGSTHLLRTGGAEQRLSAFRKEGTFDGWKRMWEAIEPHPAVGLAVYASLAPVLVGIIRAAPTFAVDWSGRQQGGKTILLRVAASVWGDPMGLIAQWRGSSVGIERNMEFFTHLPCIMDDTKQAQPPEIVTATLYQVSGVVGRLTGAIEGMRRTANLRTVLLSTGERAATTFSKDGGAASRCLAVEGLPFGRSDGAKVTAQRVQSMVMDHHGHLGPLFVEYLLTKRDEWPALAERWVKLRDEIAERTIGSDGRGAAYLAVLLLAALTMEEATGIPVRPSVMAEAEKWAAVAVRTADRPLEALRWVWSWLDQHTANVYRPRLDGEPMTLRGDFYAGWRAGDPPCVLWSALKRDMARDGFAIEDVEGEWISRGWLHPEPADPKKRHRFYISEHLGRPYVRQFTAAAVEAVGG